MLTTRQLTLSFVTDAERSSAGSMPVCVHVAKSTLTPQSIPRLIACQQATDRGETSERLASFLYIVNSKYLDTPLGKRQANCNENDWPG